MIKKMVVSLLVIILFAGCEKTSGEDIFLAHIDQLEEALEHRDWDTVQNRAKGLRNMYEKNKWKLQLLGDEGEYEGLNESINRIIAAIMEEDATNVRIEIATARTIIKDIYSF